MQTAQVEWDDEEAAALRAYQRAEIAGLYGTPDSEPGVPPSAADITAFFLARADDGSPLGCAGLRELGTDTGEIKRMYVVPAARGTGAAARLLDALESWSRARGWTRLRLETGPLQHAAVRFYTRSGYHRIPNFGAYTGHSASHCYEREL
ncbi:GNAT family N-acetyltransferase [Streptomyces sp. HNM0574]|uniref:GNAT family N-acetyltransferase n=1 Tax=Streptomyces sp. HNM0574 TaxID=2714954 RepID=UPI00146F8057|nr:GNAT family N-acetyltransferase [Streptomyces sp. HNM0574]NLU65994.1 GNAT family N-acetyltransferase [Streptomyces sp. HNM0574]